MNAENGFTLIELIVVIVIVGILAVGASSHFFDNNTFDEKFVYDEVKGVLHNIKGRAMASGCQIQVAIAASSYTANMRANCRSGAYNLPVQSPGRPDESVGNSAITDGVTLSSTVTPLIFNRRGQVTNSAGTVTDVTVTVGSRVLSIIGETGLIYDPSE